MRGGEREFREGIHAIKRLSAPLSPLPAPLCIFRCSVPRIATLFCAAFAHVRCLAFWRLSPLLINEFSNNFEQPQQGRGQGTGAEEGGRVTPLALGEWGT